jgi:parvulin-like peptidyl-prolyl isomerase
MTFLARPVVKRVQKPTWDSRDRRNFYLNLGFGLAVLAAILILAIAVAVSYYNDHLAPVGSINGETITKDDLRDRADIELWRLELAGRRIQTQLVGGRLTQAQAELQTQFVQQQRDQILPLSLEKIIDNRIQADLAVEEGIAVTDADIDAQLTEEATLPEARHAWQIEVEPEVDGGAAGPTPEQVAAARAKIDKALADIKGGAKWEDIARTVSTDTATAPQSGDLGWLGVEDTQTDEAFLTALFAAGANAPTEVVEGADGIFRIGRVTEIAPESVDEAYVDMLVNDGIDLAKYRAVVRGDVVRQKLEDKVVADLSKPGPQRETSEIYLSQATVDLPDEAVKVRHILFSPKDDPAAASGGEIPEDDPSWGQAKLDADAAYARLKDDVEAFDEVARETSDEQSARGADGTGGVLDAYVSTDGGFVPEFTDPILAAKARDGQLLPPIKTDFGYHVVQVLNHAPDLAKIKQRVDGGADFASLARELSEGDEADRGGLLGWIARGQLEQQLSDAIFGTEVGGMSDVVSLENDGAYLFFVSDEEERTPEGRQLDEIRSRAFGEWYQPKKDALTIERDPTVTSGSG